MKNHGRKIMSGTRIANNILKLFSGSALILINTYGNRMIIKIAAVGGCNNHRKPTINSNSKYAGHDLMKKARNNDNGMKSNPKAIGTIKAGPSMPIEVGSRQVKKAASRP